jgi:RNA polymerase sigma-70 factor (ECF subfamily)
MEEPGSLSKAFFSRNRGGYAGDLPCPADSIEPALQARDAAARAAWPEIPLEARAFAAHIADRLPEGSEASDAILGLHAADLFLASACSIGIGTALAAFERVHLPRVAGLVRRIDPSPAFADDVTGAMREMLLVPLHGHRPRIAEYSGRGPLSGWLRVVAIRTALRLRRQQRRGATCASDENEMSSRAPVDPELDYLKVRYRGAYADAFEAALEELPDRDALLLKLHYLDGLSIDRIGALYGIHRSTVARWRSSLRRTILARTREHLQRRLPLTDSEFDSLVAIVRSQLGVNIRAALQRPAPAKP